MNDTKGPRTRLVLPTEHRLLRGPSVFYAREQLRALSQLLGIEVVMKADARTILAFDAGTMDATMLLDMSFRNSSFIDIKRKNLGENQTEAIVIGTIRDTQGTWYKASSHKDMQSAMDAFVLATEDYKR